MTSRGLLLLKKKVTLEFTWFLFKTFFFQIYFEANLPVSCTPSDCLGTTSWDSTYITHLYPIISIKKKSFLFVIDQRKQINYITFFQKFKFLPYDTLAYLRFSSGFFNIVEIKAYSRLM